MSIRSRLWSKSDDNLESMKRSIPRGSGSNERVFLPLHKGNLKGRNLIPGKRSMIGAAIVTVIVIGAMMAIFGAICLTATLAPANTPVLGTLSGAVTQMAQALHMTPLGFFEFMLIVGGSLFISGCIAKLPHSFFKVPRKQRLIAELTQSANGSAITYYDQLSLEQLEQIKADRAQRGGQSLTTSDLGWWDPPSTGAPSIRNGERSNVLVEEDSSEDSSEGSVREEGSTGGGPETSRHVQFAPTPSSTFELPEEEANRLLNWNDQTLYYPPNSDEFQDSAYDWINYYSFSSGAFREEDYVADVQMLQQYLGDPVTPRNTLLSQQDEQARPFFNELIGRAAFEFQKREAVTQAQSQAQAQPQVVDSCDDDEDDIDEAVAAEWAKAMARLDLTDEDLQYIISQIENFEEFQKLGCDALCIEFSRILQL